MSAPLDSLAQRKRHSKGLQTVTGHSRIGLADQGNAVIRSRGPGVHGTAVKALLKKGKIESGIVRHQLGVACKLHEFPCDSVKGRCIRDHLIRDSMHRRHPARNRHPGIDKGGVARRGTIRFDAYRSEFNDPVVPGTHAGCFKVENRIRPRRLPLFCHTASG